MRIAPVALALLIAGSAAAAPPRVASHDAAHHRGEHVTLVGPVAGVESRADGTVLTIGKDAPVPARVPESVRARLGQRLADLRGRDVVLTGRLTPAGQPLELVLDRPEQLADPGSTDDVDTLRERVRALEDELARLRAAQPEDLGAVTYGAPPLKQADIPLYSPLTKVLAQRGVPSRTGWGPAGPILFYGREKWLFDEKSQLIDVRRD